MSSWRSIGSPEPRVAQVPASDPFEAVPSEARAEVKDSVDLIVKLYKERRWDKIYDLMDEPPMPRDKYLQDSVQHRSEKNADWVVNGCALVSVNARRDKWESFIDIKLNKPNKKVSFLIALKKRGGPMSCLRSPSARDTENINLRGAGGPEHRLRISGSPRSNEGSSRTLANQTDTEGAPGSSFEPGSWVCLPSSLESPQTIHPP
jgi:hypothetical protein